MDWYPEMDPKTNKLILIPGDRVAVAVPTFDNDCETMVGTRIVRARITGVEGDMIFFVTGKSSEVSSCDRDAVLPLYRRVETPDGKGMIPFAVDPHVL